ncbi:PAS domain S-box protein [Brevibacillus ginsengisoli]|uniref:PAS domain S-box protein n=2 Tax=Bacteria TaxID=2 RepID=UPI003CF02F79
MIKDFLFNATILISMFTILGQLFKRHLVRADSPVKVRSLWGVSLGILGLILMTFSIHITNSTIADLRHIATVIAAVFGGMEAALISALIIALGRVVFFGWSQQAVVAAINMLLAGIFCGWLSTFRLADHQKAFWMNIVSLGCISIAFAINLHNWDLFVGILKYHYTFSLIGCAIAYHVARYVLRSNESVNELKHVTEKYQTVVHHVKEVIFQMDIEGRWTFLNPAWEEITGFSIQESIGKSWMSQIHPDELALNQQKCSALIKREIEYCRHEIRLLHKDGSYKWVEIYAQLTTDHDGQITGVSGTLMDINARKIAEEEMFESKQKYKTLATLSPDGILVHSEGKIIFINEFGVKLFGGTRREEFIGLPIEELVVQESMPIVLEQSHRIYEQKESIHLVERKYRRRDGKVIHVEASVSYVLYDGNPSAMVIFRDISLRKEMESALIESEERFRLIAENSSDLISMHDERGSYLYVSPVCREILQYEPEELLKHTVYDFIHADDVDSVMTHQTELFKQGHSVTTYRARQRNGEYIWFESSIRLLQHVNDKATKIIAVSRNITERKEAEQKLKEANELLKKLSTIDGLTQVANRRYFDHTVSQEWQRAYRNASSLSVVMVDIDHFKAYNDTYGHQNGDDCLKHVAQTIKNTLRRSSDVVCRYGGEEFVVILPDTNEEGGEMVAELIRQSIDSLMIPHEGSSVADHVTVSLGVASIVPSKESELSELIRWADNALYQAKNEGRNRVRIGKATL